MMKKNHHLFAKITSHYGTFPLDSTRLWDNPYTGMVRLQIGHYTGQGRVEVYCNNQWPGVLSATLKALIIMQLLQYVLS